MPMGIIIRVLHYNECVCNLDNSGVLGNIRLIDDDFGPKKNTKRGILPKSATRVMKSWLFQHIVV